MNFDFGKTIRIIKVYLFEQLVITSMMTSIANEGLAIGNFSVLLLCAERKLLFKHKNIAQFSNAKNLFQPKSKKND